jgi:hypothetical protein
MTIHLTWVTVLITIGVISTIAMAIYVVYSIFTVWLFCRGMRGRRK